MRDRVLRVECSDPACRMGELWSSTQPRGEESYGQPYEKYEADCLKAASMYAVCAYLFLLYYWLLLIWILYYSHK